MKRNAGFTLIELLVVLALLGIVISLAFSLNLFGLKTFRIGDTQSSLQNELKLCGTMISSELRYATGFDLAGTVPASLGDYDGYFYYDAATDAIYQNGNRLTDAVITSCSFARDRSIVTITISGEKTQNDKTQTFEISTSVHLNNYNQIAFTGTTDSGTVILYRE